MLHNWPETVGPCATTRTARGSGLPASGTIRSASLCGTISTTSRGFAGRMGGSHDEELRRNLRGTRRPSLAVCVCQTYEAIASDLETDDKEVQVECTLDANRVATFGGDFGPQADELIRAACKEHGWDVVCRVVAAKWLY